jgi:hypothetical protein
MKLSDDSKNLISELTEIRGRSTLSILVRPDFSETLGLESVLPRFLGRMQGENIDWLYGGTGYAGDSSYRICREILERGISYSLLLTSPVEGGFLPLFGTKRLLLGPGGSVKRFHSGLEKCKRRSLLAEFEYFEKEYGREQSFSHFAAKDVLPMVLEKQHLMDRAMRIIELGNGPDDVDMAFHELFQYRFLEPVLGLRELKEGGWAVQSSVECGVDGSLSRLQQIYGDLLRISTVIEGQAGNERQANFKATAEIVGIVETPFRREICFRFVGLPGVSSTTLVWIER